MSRDKLNLVGSLLIVAAFFALGAAFKVYRDDRPAPPGITVGNSVLNEKMASELLRKFEKHSNIGKDAARVREQYAYELNRWRISIILLATLGVLCGGLGVYCLRKSRSS